jgi:transcriptional regulator with XRE-family HTH domain
MDINKLERLLKIKKISYKDLSQITGMSKNGIWGSIKKGNLKIKVLEDISRHLEVSPSYFFTESENENQISEEPIKYESRRIREEKFKLEIANKELDGIKKELAAKDRIIELLEEKLKQVKIKGSF